MGRMSRTGLLALLFLAAVPATRGSGQKEPDVDTSCSGPVAPESGMALRRACQALLERGEAPADARERALQGLPAFKLRAVATPAPRWVNIGPAPIVGGTPDTTWTARPRSGRVAAVAVDPSNSQHWLIGAAGGGIWETRDGGQSWAPRTDDQPVLTLGAIAFAPSAPKTVYAGTGEAVFSVDAYEGHGVLRSTDGGATWTHLASTTAIFLNKGFSDLAVDPTNSGIVIAAVAKAQLPRPTARASGIYKTVNGGRSWELKLGGEATDLEIDPGDFRRQYAAIGNVTPRLPLPAGIRDNGVYRSINAGDTWDPVTGPWTGGPRTIGRVELAIAPSNPDVLYVSIHDATPLPPPSTSRHNGIIGLWKTTNAWAPIPAWQQIPLGPTDNSSGEFGYCAWNPFPEPREVRQCFYNHELIVDPTDANVLYAGGIGLWRYDGATWQELALGDPARGIHADQHRMAWAGKRLIVGNDGGVWSTNNGGQRWLDHNAGLSTIQFWGGALAPTPELLALGGTQDNGTAVWMPPVLTWNGVIRGDAGPAAISPTRPRTHWAIAARGKGLEIWRTLDAGKTLKPAGKKLPAEVQQKAAIASPFVQCPVNHDVVLFADRALWRTTDFFASHPEQPIWTSNSAEANDRITAVAFAASDPTCQTYALARKGTLLMTTAGGQAAWRNLDPAGKLPKLKVPKGLAFDPRTPGTLYVVYSTFKSEEAEQGRVFRTTNALADAPTWTNIGPKNVDILHNSIALDPIDPRIVWVGTDLGVWRGDFTDGRTNPPWVHYGPEFGLPNVIVHDVKVHAASRQPVAFTHGRGAYILVDSAGWCAGTWAPTLGTNFGTCPP